MLVLAPGAQEVFIDNVGTGGFTVSGIWGTGYTDPGYSNQYFRYKNAGSGAATLTWKPTIA